MLSPNEENDDARDSLLGRYICFDGARMALLVVAKREWYLLRNTGIKRRSLKAMAVKECSKSNQRNERLEMPFV